MEIWNIEMFGGLRLRKGEQTLSRFRTQKTAALLAYLAFYADRSHPRTALAERFWPDREESTSLHSLRTALNSLRNILEPPDTPEGHVLFSNRTHVQLRQEAITTDVSRFESLLKRSRTETENSALLAEAVEIYSGALLSGHYEDWILPHSLRLEEQYLQAVHRLITLLLEEGTPEKALEYALQASVQVPLDMELHTSLIRLTLQLGKTKQAAVHYQDFTSRLLRDTGEAPSPPLQKLALDHGLLSVQSKVASPRFHPIKSDMAEYKHSSSPSSVALPASHSLLSSQSDLPVNLTRFFGRETELDELETLLRTSHRLVTLLGPGGSGKTRLARELANRLQQHRPEIIRFVSLIEVQQAADIPEAIRQALCLSPAVGMDAEEQICHALAGRKGVLILDNLEHLVMDAPPVLLSLLSRLPELSCLVTSRQALSLEGECLFPVKTLPVPADNQSPLELMQCASIQLFMDRAQSARPDFQLTRGNALAVAELCRRLEGHPLSLELAASHIRTLSPAQMLAELSDRLSFLVSRRREVVSRHRSLRATLDWSWQLLSPALQRFFARLSVFNGGWRLEDAIAVCEEENAQEMLETLQDCSLVFVEESGEVLRFRMLETMREFGDAMLEDSERECYQQRHAEHYLLLTIQSRDMELKEEEATLFQRFDEELANIESAQNWWREHDPAKLLHLCAALGWYWMLRSNANNGLKWLEAALAANLDQHTEIYAWALHGVGLLQGLRGDYRLSSATLKDCITACQQSGARWMECHANVNLAYALCELGDYDGCSYHLGNARVLYDLEGETNGQAAAWTVQGLMETRQGKYAEAAASNARSAAIYRAEKYPYGVAMAFQEMADALYHLGEYTQAVQILEECLTIKRSMRNTRSVALSLVDLSLCLLHTGEQERAKEMLIEGLLAFRQVGDRWGIARGLDVWAEMAFQSGQSRRAAEAIGACRALRETLGTPLTADRATTQNILINELRKGLGDKALECACQIGRTLSLDYFIEHHQLHFP